MFRLRSLRARIALYFAAFGALLALVMAVMMYQSAHDLSIRLVDETLNAELDDYIARRARNPHSLPPSTVILQGYVREAGETDGVPDYLAKLPPGRHEVRVGDLFYRAAVLDRDNVRYYLLHDITLKLKREQRFAQQLDIVAAAMLHTAKKYGPDRVVGFSPIPAMSMVSYAAGSRLLQLFGAPILSFYDLYADFPPASPETWGEKTDVAESADWFNSKYIVTVGSNLSMTRTPDVHFVAEARGHGAKLVVLSPDFSQISKFADWWIPVHAGMDGALWMAVNHVILKEFFVDRQVPYFVDYLKRFSDAPFLVELKKEVDTYAAGRFLRANR